MTDRVLVAGGGPVGLIAALALARLGVHVTVFERSDYLQKDPRAATTHPATLELLEDIGLAADIEKAGLVAPVFQFWDRPSGQLVAEFDHALIAEETRFPYVVQCEQFKTANIALDHLRSHDCAEVRFGAEVVGVYPDDEAVRIDVRTAKGLERHTGRYLIGADGGRSFVRKALAIPFEGYTWPEQFIVLTTPFDFARHRGYSYRSYFADPEEWCNCFKVSGEGPPGLWRTVYPTDAGAAEESLMSDDAVQARLQKFFPKEGKYEVIHRNLYRVHQRVAKRFYSGRVLLAGDAAHVNNPIGGLGLNGGIQDAVNLAEKLGFVWRRPDRQEVLRLYDQQRRTVTIEFVQAQTVQNKRRLEERDPEIRQRNLDELRAIAADPHRAKAFLMRSSMLEGQRRANAIRLAD